MGKQQILHIKYDNGIADKILEKVIFKIYNKEKLKEQIQMTKIAESLGAVYIYIYIYRKI